MARKSLSDFCVVVLKNGRFRRFKLPFEKSIQPRLSGGVGCCLSCFGTIGSEGSLPGIIGFGVGAGWPILVHEPGRLTNRLPGNPARVGGQWINIHSGRHDDPTYIPQG